MINLLTIGDFEPHLGKVFRLDGFEQPLVLDRIEPYGEPPPGFVRPPFILIFVGPRPGPVAPAAIYETTADTGESFTLHIAPILTEARDRQEYQSSFN